MTDTADTPGGRGNTRPSPHSRRSRAFTFTLWDWTQKDLDTLTHHFMGERYIIGREHSKAGRPHLQGYVHFRNPRHLSALKDINDKIHWEPARGTASENFVYCSKEDPDYIAVGIKPDTPIWTITDLYPWQKDIENLILSKPDHRAIHWFWEPIGNVGKSALCKYLCIKYDFVACCMATKSADMLTIVDLDKTVYIFDFPRSVENYEPWTALEQIKNGHITDAKLKKQARCLLFNYPHVIVFANWEPRQPTLSADRLRVARLLA